MTKPKKAAYTPDKTVPVKSGTTNEECGRNLAAVATSPELAAYRVINSSEHMSGIAEKIDVPTLMAELRDQANAVNRGDLTKAEAMLMNQATALQSLFVRLAERGMGCDTVPGFDANMRMALRAQSQCRATLETLATIKNPPVIYARQANVTSGPQQINNGMAVPSQAGEKEIMQNKLLEESHGQRLDTLTTGQAIEAHSRLAPVGAIDRAED